MQTRLTSHVLHFQDWSHISRNSIMRQKDKVYNVSNLPIMQEHLQKLHLCRSRPLFLALASLVLKDKRHRKKHAIATWFESALMPKKWTINDTQMPGQDPNSQPMESDHRNTKRYRHGMHCKEPLSVLIIMACKCRKSDIQIELLKDCLMNWNETFRAEV